MVSWKYHAEEKSKKAACKSRNAGVLQPCLSMAITAGDLRGKFEE
jgi:hypothetical protein